MPNNFQPHVPDFKRGERLSAARLNELADAIAKLLWHKQQSANAAFGVRTPLEIIGKLDDDLPAATEFATSPGEAVMTVWIKDAATGNLIETDRKESIKQRFESADEKAAGDEVRAAWIEGEWVALPGGGGGGGHEIFFEIESVTCDEAGEKTLYVTALWYDGGCTKTIPGADQYGIITVIDPCGELAYYTADWLGSGSVKGWAKYMYPRGDGYCEPEWLVRSICGVPGCA